MFFHIHYSDFRTIQVYSHGSVPWFLPRHSDDTLPPDMHSVPSLWLSWRSGASWSSWWISRISSTVVRLSRTVRGVAWSVDWRLTHRGPVAWAHSAWDTWLVCRGRSARSRQVVGLAVRCVGCASSCPGIGTDTACSTSRWALVAGAAALVGRSSCLNSSIGRTRRRVVSLSRGHCEASLMRGRTSTINW